MLRFLGAGGFGFAIFALFVFCVFDVIATDESLIRNLPKMAWLFVVLLLGPVGSLAWLMMGRPQFAGWRPGGTTSRTTRRVWSPEDDAGWTSNRSNSRPSLPSTPGPEPSDTGEVDRLADWERELREREARLEAKENGSDDSDVGGP